MYIHYWQSSKGISFAIRIESVSNVHVLQIGNATLLNYLLISNSGMYKNDLQVGNKYRILSCLYTFNVNKKNEISDSVFKSFYLLLTAFLFLLVVNEVRQLLLIVICQFHNFRELRIQGRVSYCIIQLDVQFLQLIFTLSMKHVHYFNYIFRLCKN